MRAFVLASAATAAFAAPRAAVEGGSVMDSSLAEGGEHRRLQMANTIPCTGPVTRDLLFGTAGDYGMADNICCHNSFYAEPFGYHSELRPRAFFDQLDSSAVTTFYDPVCGLPLFRGPVGRSFAAWRAESERHGWPSFRPEETFDENIIIHPGGEMSSTCGTHLGHNLPDHSGARYCIDLVRIAGPAPPASPPPPPPPPPPAIGSGDGGQISVYFGAGCYWHTQYDMYLAESAAPFSRSGTEITAHVGYAGGWAAGPGGLVCYHGGPPGSLYSDMGHGEATEVLLDDGPSTNAQFTALLEKYFEEFQRDSSDRAKTDRAGNPGLRLDPQDWGPAYRCLIGIPGGIRGALYPLIQAANRDNIQLVPGRGRGDNSDEGKIYIYDTAEYPFYRGEQYHQFHANSVLGRRVPSSYTGTLKATQAAAGLIDPTGCPDPHAITGRRQPPPPPPPPPRPPPPPPAGSGAGDWIAGTFTGVVNKADGSASRVTVSFPAAACDTGDARCGTTSYSVSGSSCEGTLAYTSSASQQTGPTTFMTIYTFSETITSGDCVSSPSIQVALVSGGLGFRNDLDQSSGQLAISGPPLGEGEDLMVSADSCAASLEVFAARLSTECCNPVRTPGASCVRGVPTACPAPCAEMWNPFASRCGYGRPAPLCLIPPLC